MRQLPALLAPCALATASAFAGSPAVEWTYQNALASSERGSELQYVLIDIEGDAALREQPMLDLMMEVAEQTTSEAGDAYLAICRALLGRDGARYAPVLTRVTAESTDVRLQKLAASVAQLDAAAPPAAYQPGSVSLEAQRRKYPPLYPDYAPATERQQQ